MKKISLLLAFLLLFTSAVSLFTSAAGNKTAWYGESLLYCIGHNYTEGDYEEFDGEECLTRGEFAHVLHSLADRPLYPLDDPDAGEEYIFPDLKFEDDYKDDILWCSNNKILVGFDDGLIRKEENITRAQLAVAFRALAVYQGFDTSAKADLSKFPDKNTVRDWSRAGIEFCVSRGVISGVLDHGKDYIRPSIPATKGMIVVMIKKYRENVMESAYKKSLANGSYFIGGGGAGDEPLTELETMELVGKENPRLLFIGFASDPSRFDGNVSYLTRLGCVCENLTYEDLKNPESAAEKVGRADIFLIDGGDTVRLTKVLKDSKVDAMLRRAAERGALFVGSSAGGICQCSSGESSTEYGFKRLNALGCVDILFCPHAFEEGRYNQAKEDLKQTPYLKCVAMDGAALEIKDGRYRAFYTHRKKRMARLLSVDSNGNVTEEDMSTEWRPVSELFTY